MNSYSKEVYCIYLYKTNVIVFLKSFRNICEGLYLELKVYYLSIY